MSNVCIFKRLFCYFNFYDLLFRNRLIKYSLPYTFRRDYNYLDFLFLHSYYCLVYVYFPEISCFDDLLQLVFMSALEFFRQVCMSYFFSRDLEEFFNSEGGSLTSLALIFLRILVGLVLIMLILDST